MWTNFCKHIVNIKSIRGRYPVLKIKNITNKRNLLNKWILVSMYNDSKVTSRNTIVMW